MMADANLLREGTSALNSVSLVARKGRANGCCVTGYIMNEIFSASYLVALLKMSSECFIYSSVHCKDVKAILICKHSSRWKRQQGGI